MAEDKNKAVNRGFLKKTTPSTSKREIEKLDNEISKSVYDVRDTITIDKSLVSIDDIIGKISTTNKNDGNALEFLTQIDFNNKNGINDSNLNNNSNLNFPKGKKNTRTDIEEIIAKSNMSDIISLENDRFKRYEDYTLIYSYIPELAACIHTLRDHILSPDDLVKNSLTFVYDNSSSYMSGKGNKNNKSLEVIQNVKKISEKYDIDNKASIITRKALMYGDFFVAVIRYDDDFNKMLLQEEQTGKVFLNSDSSYNFTNEDVEVDENFEYIAEDFMNEFAVTNDMDDSSKPSVPDVYNSIKTNITNLINKNVKFSSDSKTLLKKFKPSNTVNKKNSEKEEKPLNFRGSVVRMLEPKNVIKLELDNVCYGYLVIEREDASSNNADKFNGTFNNNGANSFAYSDNKSAQKTVNSSVSDYFNSSTDIESQKSKQRSLAIANLFTKNISKKMDMEFVKDNPEFKDYVHGLVRQQYLVDKSVSITYLSEDEVVDFIVEKQDIYGQSVFSRSVFFAKLYLSTLITEIMQKISRSRDKRIIYVETGIEKDIEGQIEAVVRDIKSKEIQTDMLKSISTILSDIGAFEDYYIPLFDGEKAIDFDTLAGMNTEVDREFLEFLIKSAIAGTDVPVNYIDASKEVDFARNLSLQNTNFIRTIVNLQRMFSRQFSKLIRILYKNELQVNKEEDLDIDLELLSVILPSPVALNTQNINDHINNATQTIDFAMQTYFSEESSDAEVKYRFKRKIAAELVPNIQWEKFDEFYKQVEIERTREKLDPSKSKDSEENQDNSNNGGGNAGW